MLLIHYFIHPHSSSLRQVLLTTNQETELLRGSVIFLKSPNDRDKVKVGLLILNMLRFHCTSSSHAKRQNITNKCMLNY